MFFNKGLKFYIRSYVKSMVNIYGLEKYAKYKFQATFCLVLTLALSLLLSYRVIAHPGGYLSELLGVVFY